MFKFSLRLHTSTQQVRRNDSQHRSRVGDCWVAGRAVGLRRDGGPDAGRQPLPAQLTEWQHPACDLYHLRQLFIFLKEGLMNVRNTRHGISFVAVLALLLSPLAAVAAPGIPQSEKESVSIQI